MRLSDIYQGENIIDLEDSFIIKNEGQLGKKLRVNILALGDVGGTLLLGLKLLGGDVIHTIGICDINYKTAVRYEMEMNQIAYPFDKEAFPQVEIVEMEDLFQCDVLVFCATKGVPQVGEKVNDVRMVQFENNKELVDFYGKRALVENFEGKFFVVSDPVDPLCNVVKNTGFKSENIQGFGLGVMNGRATYFAKDDLRFENYLKDGRVFGPHGEDLIVANSISDYSKEISNELKALTVTANLDVRELGFKPYIAPAISSGAIAIVENLRGNWHYSSMSFGKAFLGAKNRITKEGIQIENLDLNEELFEEIVKAYENLKVII